MVERSVDRRASMPVARTSPMVTTRLPAAIASSCIVAAVGEAARGRSGRCWRPAAHPRAGAHRIAVAQALGRVAHVEMGVERDQPDLVQRHAEPVHAGPGHRIVAADQQGQRMRRDARRAPRRGSAPSPARCSDPRRRRRRGRAIWRRQFAAGLDVVAADPPQRRAQQRRRQVAAARRHRPAPSGAPTSPTGAPASSVDDQVGKVGPVRSSL